MLCGQYFITAVDDALAVQKAIGKVTNRATEIGRALGLQEQRIGEIERQHPEDSRRAIAVFDSWLRGEFNPKQKPYSLHPEEHRCPSWWNLVWAVAHQAGGKNPAHAQHIAIHFKSKHFLFLWRLVFMLSFETGFQEDSGQQDFQNVSTEPFSKFLS